jgi:hypothetical protein
MEKESVTAQPDLTGFQKHHAGMFIISWYAETSLLRTCTMV